MTPITRRRALRWFAVAVGGTWASACGGSNGVPDQDAATGTTTTSPPASPPPPSPPPDASTAPVTADTGDTGVPLPADPVLIERIAPGSLDPLAAIGQAYLLDHPDLAIPDQLAAGLGLDDAGSETALAAYATFTDRIRDDFATGEVVVADGWVVALTEARLGALVRLGG